MQYKITSHYIEKKVPLTISREVKKGQYNTFLKIEHGSHVGIGETVFEDKAETTIQKIDNFLSSLKTLSPIEAWNEGKQLGLDGLSLALIASALWDLLAHQANLPLDRLLGLTRAQPKTSLTVSIGESEWVYERTKEILNTFSPYLLKIKLGSKPGIEHDKASFMAVIRAINDLNANPVQIFVDANGGWDLVDAKIMMPWLKSRGVLYIEQPLAADQDDQLSKLYQGRALPIFVDESCVFVDDVARLACVVDGINIKLLKCGGITEALRMIHVARAHHLKFMIGCFGETRISISAALMLASLLDYVDLDSFLNLKMESVSGLHSDLSFQDGKLILPEKPGLGVQYG